MQPSCSICKSNRIGPATVEILINSDETVCARCDSRTNQRWMPISTQPTDLSILQAPIGKRLPGRPRPWNSSRWGPDPQGANRYGVTDIEIIPEAGGQAARFAPEALIDRWGSMLLVALITIVFVTGLAKLNDTGRGSAGYAITALSNLFFPHEELVLMDVTFNRKRDGGADLLFVYGQIANNGSEERLVPPVELTLRQEGGHKVYQWSYRPAVRRIAAGESLRFSTSIVRPPSNAQIIEVRLSKPEHMAGLR